MRWRSTICRFCSSDSSRRYAQITPSALSKFEGAPVPQKNMDTARNIFNTCANCFRDVIDVCHAYDLVRDDFDAINELCAWPNQSDPWLRVGRRKASTQRKSQFLIFVSESKTKAALTRALNKDTHRLPFATSNDVQIATKTTAGKRMTAKAAKAQMNALLDTEKKAKAKKSNEIDDDEEAAAANEEEALADAINEEQNAEILDAY